VSKIPEISVLAVALVPLAACVPVPGPPSPGLPALTGAPTRPESAETPITAEAAAGDALAAKLGIAAEMITLVSAERVE
jgi:hypothetical protein